MMMIIMICSWALFSLQQVDDRLCVVVSTRIIRGNLSEREKENIFSLSLSLFSSNRRMKLKDISIG
jgi:hypothetical protein